MDIYLPVAEMSVNLFWVLGLGGVIGFLSGLFGVGGGFLMTPMLILMGIPPAVAVGTQAAQILASSVSGVLFWTSDMSTKPAQSCGNLAPHVVRPSSSMWSKARSILHGRGRTFPIARQTTQPTCVRC